jgi:hypothetical protein
MSACRVLRGFTNLSPTWVNATMTWSFYTADGYYFAIGIPNTHGTDGGILLVFDPAWHRVAALAA